MQHNNNNNKLHNKNRIHRVKGLKLAHLNNWADRHKWHKRLVKELLNKETMIDNQYSNQISKPWKEITTVLMTSQSTNLNNNINQWLTVIAEVTKKAVAVASNIQMKSRKLWICLMKWMQKRKMAINNIKWKLIKRLFRKPNARETH
jgi:hypothetical protein